MKELTRSFFFLSGVMKPFLAFCLALEAFGFFFRSFTRGERRVVDKEHVSNDIPNFVSKNPSAQLLFISWKTSPDDFFFFLRRGIYQQVRGINNPSGNTCDSGIYMYLFFSLQIKKVNFQSFDFGLFVSTSADTEMRVCAGKCSCAVTRQFNSCIAEWSFGVIKSALCVPLKRLKTLLTFVILISLVGDFDNCPLVKWIACIPCKREYVVIVLVLIVPIKNGTWLTLLFDVLCFLNVMNEFLSSGGARMGVSFYRSCKSRCVQMGLKLEFIIKP